MLFLMPSSVKADPTTLASWTFDTEYDVAENVYTPNGAAKVSSEAASKTSAIWTWNQQILPNTYIGTQSNYYVSGKTARYWYLIQHWYNSESNYGPFVFQICNDTESNSISDYTDPTEHNNYFEISFPTTNYKNINVSYKVASGSGTADEMTVVYSADGGITWGVAGTTSTPAAWYQYTSDSKELAGTANKASVKVRIIAANGVQTNWNIDDVVITGEYATVFAEEYTLTTSVTPTNAGKITRSPNAAAYEENTVVSLTATPNIGYAFVEWQDGLGNTLSTANPYDVTMTENKTIVAVYEIAPIAAGTEITAASWTFDTGYDAAGLVYTPNDEEFEEIAQTQAKNGNVPQILANTFYTTQSDYVASVSNDDGGNIYYKVFDNALSGTSYGQVFCLNPTSSISNDITSYTTVSQHKVYYEFRFPTIGLRDINISYDITHAKNEADDIHVVYSTDGGTTWVEGTTGKTKENWWLYKTNTSDLAADNSETVIVRLLPENGKYERFYLLNFIVKGTIATTDVIISDAKYSTYYNSVPVQLPANLEAATIDNETSGTLTLNYRYGEGDVIPGGTPVLLKASAADTYTLTYVANYATAAPNGNYLYGSDVETTTTGGGTGAKYYALMNGANGLGFYWKAADGAAFTSGAHKAWLALPASAGAPFFALDGMEATGIDAVSVEGRVQSGVVYNLNGQRVNATGMKRGLFVVGGKKVVVK